MRRLAAFSHDRRRTVLGAWLALLVFSGALAATVGQEFRDVFSLPGTESQRALTLLEEKFPQQAGESAQVVFAVRSGTLEERRQKIDRVLAEVRKDKKLVQAVTSPLDSPGSVSRDGRIGFGTVAFNGQFDDLDVEALRELVDRTLARGDTDLRVEFGGQVISFSQQPEQSPAEAIGILVALVVLFVTLGSVVAAGLPLITAILALLVGASLVFAATGLFDIATFAPTLASMIGLGVGIDYALLLVTRFRAERALGHDVRESVITAVDTAGRAVLFAGITVVIALLGMLLLGISFLRGPAVAAALAVLLTMAASLTLLPAIISSRHIGRRIKTSRRAATGTSEATGPWVKWAALINRRPWPFAIVSLALLLLIASPVLNMRFGSTDAGVEPEDRTTRQAYDLLAQGFGPGFNGPLLMTVELPDTSGGAAQLPRIQQAIEGAEGIAGVAPPQLNPARDTATLLAFPATGPQDQRTKDLIERLRADVLPPVERETRANVSVAGGTAGQIDFNDVVSSKLPLFIGTVVALSLLLLVVVFRSLLVPLKAALMNLLSILAAFGVVTWVFQEGNLAGLIGVDSTGPIESFLPVMLFALVFGLSMDYEVFLVTRMHEEWEKTRDARFASEFGLAMTGKVVAAAGIIMVSVFGAFILGDDRIIKLFGLGLASAIFIDAFIIRLVLVPAIMRIAGARMWWLPSWLDKRLPRLSIEGPAHEEGDGRPAAPAPSRP